MSAELISTATGYGADPTRLGPNVLVYKHATPRIKNRIGGAIFRSEVCHPRYVLKLYGGVNFSQNTTINMAK